MEATGVMGGRAGWRTAVAVGAAHLAVVWALVSLARHAPPDPDSRIVYMDLLEVPPPQAVAVVQRVPKPGPRITPPGKAIARKPAVSQPAAIESAPAPVSEAPVPAQETAAAPAVERLDIASLRAAAGEMERRRVRSPLELVREQQRMRPAGDTATARAISKAKRADCRSAYGGGTEFNVLALIPLAVDTLTDTGCKW